MLQFITVVTVVLTLAFSTSCDSDSTVIEKNMNEETFKSPQVLNNKPRTPFAEWDLLALAPPRHYLVFIYTDKHGKAKALRCVVAFHKKEGFLLVGGVHNYKYLRRDEIKDPMMVAFRENE